MKSLNIQHINYGLIALSAFLIPLYQPLVRYSIGLLVLVTLFNLKKPSKKELYHFAPILFYFIWLCVGMFWTENIDNGWEQLEHSLSFLLFPFVFGFSKIEIKKYVSRILSFFTYGVLISLSICILLAIYRFSTTNDLKFFYYADLSFFHHPTYMALFGGVSLIHLYYALLNPKDAQTLYFKTQSSKFALIALISIFTLLLMSKAGIIMMLVINFIGVLMVFKSRNKLKHAFFILTGMIMLVVGTYLLIKPLQNRVNEAWVALTEEGDSQSSTGARVLVWESSFSIIEDNVLLGVGTGDLSDELDKIYLEKEYTKLYTKSLNSHNQFLEAWAKNGIIGLISLIGIFFYIFKAYDNKQPLFITLLVIGNMMMESMLEIQSGIVVIALIVSMFVGSLTQKTA